MKGCIRGPQALAGRSGEPSFNTNVSIWGEGNLLDTAFIIFSGYYVVKTDPWLRFKTAVSHSVMGSCSSTLHLSCIRCQLYITCEMYVKKHKTKRNFSNVFLPGKKLGVAWLPHQNWVQNLKLVRNYFVLYVEISEELLCSLCYKVRCSPCFRNWTPMPYNLF